MERALIILPSGVSIPAVWHFTRSEGSTYGYSFPLMRALFVVLCYVVLHQIIGLSLIMLALFDVIDLPDWFTVPDWSPYAPGERMEVLDCILPWLLGSPCVVFVVAYVIFKIRSEIRR